MTTQLVDLLWPPLHDIFEELLQDVAVCNPHVWSTLAHHETEVFPFTGYMSLGKAGMPGEEDLVLTFGIQKQQHGLLIRVDIARGDGQVVADGPAFEIMGTPLDQQALQEARDGAVSFFSVQRQLLRDELCDEAPVTSK